MGGKPLALDTIYTGTQFLMCWLDRGDRSRQGGHWSFGSAVVLIARNTEASYVGLKCSPGESPVGLPSKLQHNDASMTSALDITDATWNTEVLKSRLPVLVEFWAPWCQPCTTVSVHVDRLAESYDGKLKVVKLNTQDNSEVPSRYGITAIPTMLVVKGDVVVDQMIGLQGYAALEEFVGPHLPAEKR